MPSVSGKQHRFMAMASTPAGRAKLRAEGHKAPPANVAADFLHADKGKHFTSKAFKGKKHG
jgi:hypothetical protein